MFEETDSRGHENRQELRIASYIARCTCVIHACKARDVIRIDSLSIFAASFRVTVTHTAYLSNSVSRMYASCTRHNNMIRTTSKYCRVTIWSLSLKNLSSEEH